jgi:hypothetical protein
MKPPRALYLFAFFFLLIYGGYLYSAWNGYRWLGDDNQSSSRHSGFRGSHFYHK